VVAVVVPPARLHSLDLETALAERLGYPVHLGGAAWRWDPWPTVELRDVVAYPRGSRDLPIAIRARNVLLRGGLLGSSGRPYREVELAGLDLSLGPLAVRDAVVSLELIRDALRVRGSARGAQGGSVEVSGSLGGPDRAVDPLRIYLAQLELPLLDLLPEPPKTGGGPIQFSGLVTIEGDLEQSQKIDLDLEGIGQRRNGGGDWLRTTIRGQLLRQNGRFQSGRPLRIHGELRELDASRELRALHGLIDMSVELIGDQESGQLSLEADLEKLRLRLAHLFEKSAGSPGSAQYEAYWASNGRVSSLGIFELGTMRFRFDSIRSRTASGWRLRGLSLPLSELRACMPALRALPVSARGEVGIDIDYAPARGIEGEIVLRDVVLDLGTGSIEIPSGRIHLSPNGAAFQATQLVLAGQPMSVDGSVEWVPSPARTRVRLAIRAGRLDLERAMAVTAALWGGDEARPKAAAPLSSTAAGVELVQALRAHPRLLARLQIDPATLEVGRLTGFGVAQSNVRYRLELADQVLRLEQGERSGPDPQQRYTLDLKSWVPKLTKSQ